VKIHIEVAGETFQIDPWSGQSIAIDLDLSGPQPVHFDAPSASGRVYSRGRFVGDVSRGGSCNVQHLSLIPHCNGTHTETISHVVEDTVPIGGLGDAFQLASLISLRPVQANTSGESYRPELQPGDWVITSAMLLAKLQEIRPTEALIVRTLPNALDKRHRNWSDWLGTPFFTNEALRLIADAPIRHLLVDLPSIDRVHDEGLLSNHRIFWNLDGAATRLDAGARTDRTITEMVYVPDAFTDGVYLLNLQVPAWLTDAAPSRPLLFELT